MNHELHLMCDEHFADYLRKVGRDYLELGAEATAEDYFEAARRIEEIPINEQEAYAAGMLDAEARFGQ